MLTEFYIAIILLYIYVYIISKRSILSNYFKLNLRSNDLYIQQKYYLNFKLFSIEVSALHCLFLSFFYV